MNEFGEVLRSFREMTRDPDRHNRALSQARLGELIGHEMDDRGVTGAAISEWERGKSKVSVEDRNVLVATIRVLCQFGGIRIPDDANRLLEAGDYRALNRKEIEEIFGKIPEEPAVAQPQTKQKISPHLIPFLMKNLFVISESDLKEAFAQAEDGPSPAWPRVLAALMRKTSERISFSPKFVLWIGIWWIAWWLIAPSLRWPFENRSTALQAIGMYVVGSVMAPLLIGMLVNTKHNEYWEEKGLTHSIILRLYTYQGAGIGLNLGYFFILPVVLIRHYLNFESSNWTAFIAVTLGLILGNMSARVVPHNLWLVYRRLHLGDGAIFFVVAFIGPLWGLFFSEYYSVLLTPFWGGMIILVALMLFIMIPVGQSKKKTDTKQAQP